MRSIDPDVRVRLLHGLPPLVQGMAEAILAEWQSAVTAVPELERLAEEDVLALLEMGLREREWALRQRWRRLTDGQQRPEAVEVPGRAMARPVPRPRTQGGPQPAMTTP